MVLCVFLGLGCFTWYTMLHFHLITSKNHFFFFFLWGRIKLHCVYVWHFHYSFNWKKFGLFPFLDVNLGAINTHQDIDYLTRIPMPDKRSFHLSFDWSWSVQKTSPKLLKLLLLPFVVFHNLCLRHYYLTCYILQVQDLEGLPSPLWELTLTVLEGVVQAAKEEKQSVVLPSYKACQPQLWPAWWDTSKSARVLLISCQECWQETVWWDLMLTQ